MTDPTEFASLIRGATIERLLVAVYRHQGDSIEEDYPLACWIVAGEATWKLSCGSDGDTLRIERDATYESFDMDHGRVRVLDRSKSPPFAALVGKQVNRIELAETAQRKSGGLVLTAGISRLAVYNWGDVLVIGDSLPPGDDFHLGEL
jgi:hypothetical protein